MKYLLFLLCFALFACGDPLAWLDNCPWEKNKEFIRIVPITEIDTIISEEIFNYRSEYNEYETKYMDLGSDPLSVTIVAGKDSLNYSLEIKNQNNIFIIVDILDNPCDSDSVLSKKGYGHYRVDTERIHSCVFYYEQECY